MADLGGEWLGEDGLVDLESGKREGCERHDCCEKEFVGG